MYPSPPPPCSLRCAPADEVVEEREDEDEEAEAESDAHGLRHRDVLLLLEL